MKTHSIILTPDEVRAFLDGRKTQMRVPLKNQIDADYAMKLSREYSESLKHIGPGEGTPVHLLEPIQELLEKCPYTVGDKIVGKETWGSDCSLGMSKTRCRCLRHTDCIVYREQVESANYIDNEMKEWVHSSWKDHWEPSSRMPAWASRIHRTITAVRVEHVQDISPQDAVAMGIMEEVDSLMCFQKCREYWESRHSKGVWDRNDWVIVLELSRDGEGK